MSKCFAFSNWVPTLIKSGCINTCAPFNPAWMYAISPPPTFGKLKQTFWLISLNLRCFDLLWPTAMGKFNRPWIICFCVVSGGVWSSSGSAVLGQFPKVFLQGWDLASEWIPRVAEQLSSSAVNEKEQKPVRVGFHISTSGPRPSLEWREDHNTQFSFMVTGWDSDHCLLDDEFSSQQLS